MPSKFFLQHKKSIIKMSPVQIEEKKKELQDRKNDIELTDKMKKVSVKDNKEGGTVTPKSSIKPLKYKL